MSRSVTDHYEDHLGPIYEWMVGDFETASKQSAEYFDSIQLCPGDSGVAVDLGSGHGIQTIPLATSGFNVIAIDSCELLLDSLKARAGGLRVRTICDDLCSFRSHLESKVDAIVCMGDTLTHLPSTEDVSLLLTGISNALASGGVFSASFRDYTSHELSGVRRFIPVRADDTRIHTCFLEYESDRVRVHDLVYTKVDGNWKLEVSDYHKIRLRPSWVIETARQNGLELFQESTQRGMGFYAFRLT